MLGTLLYKDLRCLFRERRFVFGSAGFALLLVVISSFSFREVGMNDGQVRALIPGIDWLVFLFSGVTVLNHSFVGEKENDALLGTVMSGADLGMVFLSKAISNFIYLFMLQVGVLFALSFFLAVAITPVLLPFLAIIFLATVGFSTLGTLLSAMSVATSSREIVLPILLFSLLIPFIVAATSLTRGVLLGQVLSFDNFWLVLLVVFDLISSVLGFILFEYLVVE